MTSLEDHGVETVYADFIKEETIKTVKSVVNIGSRDGLDRIYVLWDLIEVRLNEKRPRALNSKGDEDAYCAYAAAVRVVLFHVECLRGSIKGLKVLNQSEVLCSDDEVTIDPFEVAERLHALVHAASILSHFKALDNEVYPRKPVVR